MNLIASLLVVVLACAPARADNVVKTVNLPAGLAAPIAPQVNLPSLNGLPLIPPGAYGDLQLQLPASLTVPELAVQAAAQTPALPEKLAALGQGVAQAAQALDKPAATAADARSTGEGVERLLTGEKPAKTVASAPEVPAITPEAASAVAAVSELARAADDLGAAHGLKISKMTGAQFIAEVEQARQQEDARDTASASVAVREAVVRVVKALVSEDKPMAESAPRLFAVWQVFGQEMQRAAPGGAQAVAADAALFASQVEASVPPARAPPAAKEEVRPEDPDGMAAIATPGSVFGWQPIERSPNHGLPFLDSLIRRALGEKKSPYEAGFELKGAASREEAQIKFYGERHTDGGLITANMKRIVSNAKPGRPMIVLVEGYTGWEMQGHTAVEYLAKRGLDVEALKARGAGELVVRGWDTIDGYNASKHPLLQHHMDLLELNRLAFSDLRGWNYYKAVARAVWTALRGWAELWRLAVVARNEDLNRAVARAAAEADETGATVHVIAGTDHLMENPRLNDAFPRLARPSFRRSLRAALGGRTFWASQPANTR